MVQNPYFQSISVWGSAGSELYYCELYTLATIHVLKNFFVLKAINLKLSKFIEAKSPVLNMYRTYLYHFKKYVFWIFSNSPFWQKIVILTSRGRWTTQNVALSLLVLLICVSSQKKRVLRIFDWNTTASEHLQHQPVHKSHEPLYVSACGNLHIVFICIYSSLSKFHHFWYRLRNIGGD